MAFYETSTIKPLYDKFIAPLTPDAIADDNELLFTLENIYWSKVNVNRENSLPEFSYNIEFHLSKLAVDICKYGALLHPKLPTIEAKVAEYMKARSTVPITAVAVLDKTMNYVVLVQSYSGFEDSWTFPKGERGAKETPAHCAIKYADMLLGYNVKKKLAHNTIIEKKIGKHDVKLLIATDAGIDFKFKPKVERAIHKIQWFSVWDLPQGKDDSESCARLEMTESHFTSVALFVSEIQEFVHKTRRSSNLLQASSDIGKRNSSAFMPVVPKKSSGSNLSQSSSTFPAVANAPLSPLSVTTSETSGTDSVFKPLTISNQCSPITQQSFTGLSFLHLVANTSQSPNSKAALKDSNHPTEIKHPKAIQPSKLKILVYECQDYNRKNKQAPEEAALDRTAELCLSTLESVLQTPAVERKPFPGEIETSLLRGSVPYEPLTSPAGLEEIEFNRTPRSSRRRGTRPRRKTRKSQNEDRESISPGHPEEPQHVHEQGININVGSILREPSPQPKGFYAPSPPSIHQNPGFSVFAPVATTRTFVPFTRSAGTVSGSFPVFSETSAFTPVKSQPSVKSRGPINPSSSWDCSLQGHKNGNTNGSNDQYWNGTSRSITFEPIDAWSNFKLDTNKLLAVYNESVQKICNV